MSLGLFTCIIRSRNKTLAGDSTSSCSIQLGGLPTKFKEFEVEVCGFYVSTYNCVFAAATIIELRSDNMGILNGFDT